MVTYTINRNKRCAGNGNLPGESIRELLRIVHSEKDGIAESDIRVFAQKPPLRITVNKTVNNHLNTLEKKHFVRHDFIKGIGNTWYSEVYPKINNGLKDCDLPMLTGEEEELVDFLIKYSNTFFYFLNTMTWSKLIKQMKLLQKLEKISPNSQKNMNLVHLKFGILSPVDRTSGLWDFGKMWLSIDVAKGDIDINNSNFIKDYEVILSRSVSLDEAKRIVNNDVVAINQIKEPRDDLLKEIECNF